MAMGDAGLHLDLGGEPPGSPQVMAALRNDDRLEELADLRRALRAVDPEQLDPAASTALRQTRSSVRVAWREQFQATLEDLRMDSCQPAPAE